MASRRRSQPHLRQPHPRPEGLDLRGFFELLGWQHHVTHSCTWVVTWGESWGESWSPDIKSGGLVSWGESWGPGDQEYIEGIGVQG